MGANPESKPIVSQTRIPSLAKIPALQRGGLIVLVVAVGTGL